jgi:hypothetical protein
LRVAADFSLRHPIAIAPPSLRNFLGPEFNSPRVRRSLEFLRLPCLAHPSSEENRCTYLPRFLALLATSRACVHFSARLPNSSHTLRPQVFATSRRFSPHSRSRAYFIPLPRPGPSCSGSSPLAQPPLLIGESVPPCRCSRRAHRRSGVRAPNPRLRGLHPRQSALLRAPIIHRSPRSLPSSGFSPPGLHFLAVHPFYSDAPLLMLPSTAFAFALAALGHLQRLLHEETG